jgi:hypothetical protein
MVVDLLLILFLYGSTWLLFGCVLNDTLGISRSEPALNFIRILDTLIIVLQRVCGYTRLMSDKVLQGVWDNATVHFISITRTLWTGCGKFQMCHPPLCDGSGCGCFHIANSRHIQASYTVVDCPLTLLFTAPLVEFRRLDIGDFYDKFPSMATHSVYVIAASVYSRWALRLNQVFPIKFECFPLVCRTA